MNPQVSIFFVPPTIPPFFFKKKKKKYSIHHLSLHQGNNNNNKLKPHLTIVISPSHLFFFSFFGLPPPGGGGKLLLSRKPNPIRQKPPPHREFHNQPNPNQINFFLINRKDSVSTPFRASESGVIFRRSCNTRWGGGRRKREKKPRVGRGGAGVSGVRFKKKEINQEREREGVDGEVSYMDTNTYSLSHMTTSTGHVGGGVLFSFPFPFGK